MKNELCWRQMWRPARDRATIMGAEIMGAANIDSLTDKPREAVLCLIYYFTFHRPAPAT